MALEPKDEIRTLLARINDAWLKGRPEDLPSLMNGCFSENIVVVGPGFQVIGRGREACIASYGDFVRAAKIEHHQFSEPAIDVWDDAAVASYAWEITYKMEGNEHRDSGHDVFVFTHVGGNWRAVWRALLVS